MISSDVGRRRICRGAFKGLVATCSPGPQTRLYLPSLPLREPARTLLATRLVSWWWRLWLIIEVVVLVVGRHKHGTWGAAGRPEHGAKAWGRGLYGSRRAHLDRGSAWRVLHRDPPRRRLPGAAAHVATRRMDRRHRRSSCRLARVFCESPRGRRAHLVEARRGSCHDCARERRRARSERPPRVTSPPPFPRSVLRGGDGMNAPRRAKIAQLLKARQGAARHASPAAEDTCTLLDVARLVGAGTPGAGPPGLGPLGAGTPGAERHLRLVEWPAPSSERSAS